MIPMSPCLVGLFYFLVITNAQCNHDSEKPEIYDPETARCYPISETSLRYDHVFAQRKPDENEFPPEYLNDLLSHCNDSMPGFVDFFQKAWISFKEFGLNWNRYPFTWNMFVRYLMIIDPMQIVHVLLWALLLTIARITVEKWTLQPLIYKVGISKSSARKLIESGWKTFWCTIMWLLSFKILILSGRSDFYKPLCILGDSQFRVGYFDIPLPSEYYVAYVLQIGFYVHALWSVFFIDTWRKDSTVTALHHVLTCLLLQGSIMNRFHRIGLLVLFCHDFSDIFLELGKLNICLKVRFGKFKQTNIFLANLLFVIFTASWVLFRLYWFPLKVLHATTWGAYIVVVGREARGYLFFNIMLWTLFGLHWYWFTLIIRMAFRIILSPPEELNDVREYDSEDDQKQINKQNGSSLMQNGDSSSAQTIKQNGKKKQ